MDEERIERQYQSLFENLRAELQRDRFERYLLAVVQGLLANPNYIKLSADAAETFTVLAFNLATALSEAASPETDVEDESPSPLVVP